MQLSYGAHLFDPDSLVIDAETTLVIDQPGMPPRARHDKMTVWAWLTGASQADIISASLALNAALNVPFQDLVLRDDNGDATTNRLYNLGSTTGVVITKGPVYSVLTPTNLAGAKTSNSITSRSAMFVAEATYPLVGAGTLAAGGVAFGGNGPGGTPALPGSGTGWIQAPAFPFPGGGGFGGTGGNNLPGQGGAVGFPGIPPALAGQLGAGVPSSAAAVVIKFQETVKYSGGTPHYVFMPCINGPFVKALIYPQTPCIMVQSGSATGYLSWPPVPPPLSPANLIDENFSRLSPQRSGLAWEQFTVNWTYTHESISPLSGVPNVWRL